MTDGATQQRTVPPASVGAVATAPPAPVPRGTPWQRARASLIAVLAWLAWQAPEGVALRAADAAGWLWYRLTPRRAALARRQLRRVALDLAERGAGPPAARGAAHDPRALERLVRSAYVHAARYYLEVMRLPRWTPRLIDQRLVVETPDVVDAAFATDGPAIFVAMHFGALEMPAIYLSHRSGRTTTVPMETVSDPEVQRWIVRTREQVGVRIIGLAEARHELGRLLRNGELVGLVADRDITGAGAEVRLFGHPARLPIGAALLAIESGAPVYLAAIRRAGPGRYRGGLARVDVPTAGTRRERLGQMLRNLADGFETFIGDAPEQWWAVFHPIWPDLAAPDEERAA